MHSEIASIREQMRSDFSAVMLGLSTQRDALQTSMKEMEKALSEQERILSRFANSTDKRLVELMAVVERIEQWRATVDTRLDRIEKKLA